MYSLPVRRQEYSSKDAPNIQQTSSMIILRFYNLSVLGTLPAHTLLLVN